MIFKQIKKRRLSYKIFICLIVIFVIPITVMTNLTFDHLRTIKNVTLKQTKSALINSQVEIIKNYLSQKAEKISTEFSNIEEKVHLLGALSQAILKNPEKFLYRNGSHYILDKDGDYSNSTNDGNSSLYISRAVPSLNSLVPAMEDSDFQSSQLNVPGYRPAFDPLISATESLDILLKPLVKSEPRVVLGWFIHKDLISRTYPWRDFKRLPRYPKVTSWPFYYLSDLAHNPSRKEIFTPLYSDPLTQQNMISCLCPVFVDNKQMATVGVDITVESILREIKQVHLSPGSSSLLLSNNEIIAASSNFPLAALGLNPQLPPYGQTLDVESLSEAGRLIARPKLKKFDVDFINTDTLKAYVGYAEVEPLGWRLFLLVPEADLIGPVNTKAQAIFSEADRIRGNFIHVLIFAVLAMTALGCVVLAHQFRGLRTLLGGIQEFGRGNLSHRIRGEESEFPELAQALNSMAENLLTQNLDLEKAYAEVEQGRKLEAVGRLAAGVAHEVNNPLATISTYTQLLLRRTDIPSEVSGSLSKVMGEVDRIQIKLRNFLDLSRLQSFVKTWTNPNVLVEDVAEMAQHEARILGVTLKLELSEEPQECYLDPSGFKQVLWNLLGNAIASQGEGGEVRVQTHFNCYSDGGVPTFVLVVEDEGPGVADEVLPHIFDPFFTTKEVGKGTGLGLAVVSSIVEGHHGKIKVQNLVPKGCQFSVVFPVGERE